MTEDRFTLAEIARAFGDIPDWLLTETATAGPPAAAIRRELTEALRLRLADIAATREPDLMQIGVCRTSGPDEHDDGYEDAPPCDGAYIHWQAGTWVVEIYDQPRERDVQEKNAAEAPHA